MLLIMKKVAGGIRDLLLAEVLENYQLRLRFVQLVVYLALKEAMQTFLNMFALLFSGAKI